jgi:anti-sigma factor RsiW
MTVHHHFSKEILTAFLDGEVTPDVRRRIGAELFTNANLSAQLEALSLDRSQLKTDFEGLLQSAPPYSVKHAAAMKAVPDPTANRIRFACVAAVCALLGWGAATELYRPTLATWQERAAVYHSLYVNSTLNNVVTNPAKMKVEFEQVTTTLGKNILLENLQRVPEFEYKRSQILGFQGRDLMQIAFLSNDGSPVVLCIMRSDTNTTRDIKTDDMQGMAAATWSKGAYEYLLIGGSDRNLIARAANTFAAIL